MSNPDPTDVRLRLRLIFGEAFMIGPGKAELLERIRDTGSISAAGRQMAMSYKRAWSLVDELNAAFREPLVESQRGGSGGGGASLTPTGAEVLRLFRASESAVRDGAAKEIEALGALLRPVNDMSEKK